VEPEYRHFDLILRSKFNSRFWHPENIRPWGLWVDETDHRATDGALYRFALGARAVLVNFGASASFPLGTRTPVANAVGEENKSCFTT